MTPSTSASESSRRQSDGGTWLRPSRSCGRPRSRSSSTTCSTTRRAARCSEALSFRGTERFPTRSTERSSIRSIRTPKLRRPSTARAPISSGRASAAGRSARRTSPRRRRRGSGTTSVAPISSGARRIASSSPWRGSRRGASGKWSARGILRAGGRRDAPDALRGRALRAFRAARGRPGDRPLRRGLRLGAVLLAATESRLSLRRSPGRALGAGTPGVVLHPLLMTWGSFLGLAAVLTLLAPTRGAGEAVTSW